MSVDDDGRDCPAASFARVQDAVDAAHPGDVVAICPGTYPEGSGAPGTNALTIMKSLTLKGAGADLVRITPRPPAGGQIADPADLDCATASATSSPSSALRCFRSRSTSRA